MRTTDNASLSASNAAAAVEEWQRKRADEQKNLIAADMAPLTGYLKPISTAPTMWSLNGFGTTLLGCLPPTRRMPQMYFARLWVIILWIPIIPLGIYLVNEVSHNRYQFLSEISSEDFHRIYKSSILKFYLLTVAYSLAFGLAIIGLLVAISALGGGHGTFRVRL
jgi:hypothetical protein